ncbi:response regulator [Robertmurraya andreesenii]|uniref:Two-component system response regulator YesN n=1 Tax=Anoxybacillus andreesenii TaxID=1325932 RepID=A0ABT9UZC1_9BACL|nr:response regulator [Robertmurraya andreesenii]MDQ0154043.1 two-component system response regulator YesN [Robertmurraya andreesenii]
MKLLIVDDEQVEREAMEVILQKAYPNLIIKQAKNGNMAVEIAHEFQPDLVLMDIKMPGMNGLEAVEQISTDYPHIKFIMVTAYDMYDYLRSAIKLGVKDYLLKPSNTKEILHIVGKVMGEIEQEKKRKEVNKIQSEAFQKALAIVETDVVTQLLFDHVHEIRFNMLVEMLGVRSTNEMFVICVIMPKGCERSYFAVKEKMRQIGSGWVGALSGNQLPIIVFREPEKSYRSQAIFLAREILSIAPAGQFEEWFVGIGDVTDSLEELRQSYHNSLIATLDITLPSKYRFFSDVPNLEEYCEEDMVTYRENEFSDLIRLGKWEQIHLNVRRLIQCYERKGADLLQSQQRLLESLWIISRVMNEMGVEAVTPLYSFKAQNYRQLYMEAELLIDKMKQTYEEYSHLYEADTIKQIKQYIMEHSHENISLETLAQKVGLSPIYISKMFKEKLGINYIDFLTDCRIEKAKKLLCDPIKSIKEISFEVGYHEPNYFSKVFKKVCQMSPKEYRRTFLEKRA